MKTKVAVNFTKFNTNKKNETIMEFQVRGDLTDEQIVKLHKLKAIGTGVVGISTSQLDLDDIEDEPHKGITGAINHDGTVDIDKDQMSIEDLKEEETEISCTDLNEENENDDLDEEGEEEEDIPYDTDGEDELDDPSEDDLLDEDDEDRLE